MTAVAVVVGETGRVEVQVDRQVRTIVIRSRLAEHSLLCLDELLAQLLGRHLVDLLEERVERRRTGR